MSSCMMAKFGSGIALGGAAIASVDPATATGFVNQHGVVGVLIVIALVLWAKSERQERESEKRRDARDERTREEQKRLIETLSAITNAINNLREHCAAVHRNEK